MGIKPLPRAAVQEKQCRHCLKVKNYSEFYKRAQSPDFLHPHCKPCCLLYRREYQDRRGRKLDYERFIKNKEFHYERSRLWRKRNRDKVIARQKASNDLPENKEKRRQYLKKPDVAARVRRLGNARQNRKRRESIAIRLHTNIRSVVSRAIKKQRVKKTYSITGELPYSTHELIAHLEKQFLPGMSWSNYGQSGWHVDHIVPVSSFDFTKLEEVKRCWSLTNLRPLWAEDNLKKRDKRNYLL